MKTIKVIFVSSRDTARQECANLIARNPDIELTAIPSGLTEQGTWLALSRSDVMIVDEMVIRREGFESLRSLLAAYPGVKSLLLIDNFSENKMIWAIMQGVRGVMVHGDVDQLLGKAVRQLYEGEIWLPRSLLTPIRNGLKQQRDVGSQYRQSAEIINWGRWH